MYTLKKSLGQHFLKDEGICKKIVEQLNGCVFTNLVEVGPGGGALTKYLLQLQDINFKAVELDDEKVIFLKNAYPQLEDKIIAKSILEIDKPFDGTFAVIGNFPYNISTEIVFKMIDWKEDVQCMIGMFQKEVAQRLAAKEGSKIYGVTSVLTQAYYDVAYLFEVDESNFTPPPKVKSAVIRMTPRSDELAMKSSEKFKQLVKAAFNQRRKTLRNAVKPYFIGDALQDPIFDKRAEQLSVADFAALTFQMQ
ncbi:MAG TPA: 16S rRNA (adenine(1518)-N(6)/adenine(1519)-N(6))-dimethyltransferase RsmA [Chitinophagaceae bacterium]|nr:16S rRNA (adenine(1518)-N(6)/adenine(1519)-N(6))-dimethyltransferase RsmA [Chitinophagaceae bacterium]